MATEKMKNIAAIQLLLEIFVFGEIQKSMNPVSRRDAYMFLRDSLLISGPHITEYVADNTGTEEPIVTPRGEFWIAAMRNLPLPVEKTVFEIPEQS